MLHFIDFNVKTCEDMAKIARLGIRSFAHSLFALSLKIAHFREQPWAICSCPSLQTRESLSSLFKKERLARQFFTFFYPRANRSHHSLLIRTFFKSDLSNLLLSLFRKERLWAICSGCSWQKSDGSNLLFFTSESLFHSLFKGEKIIL